MEKVNYLYKGELGSGEYYPNKRNDSKFRSLYGFKDEINSLTINSIYSFDSVIAESIIIDIDNGENIECALADADKIIKYLSDKHNAKVNVFWSGKNGVHIEIPLKEPIKLRLIKNPKEKNKKRVNLSMHTLNY